MNRTPWASRRGFLLAFGAAYLVLLAVFAYFASEVEHFPGELRISSWVESWRATWLDGVMEAISAPGFRLVALPLVGLTAAYLFVTGRRKESGLLLGAIIVTSAINFGLREIVARPRPEASADGVFGGLAGFSFPSGHVMQYVVFLGTLVIISNWSMRPSLARRLLHAGIALALVAIGVSRIYLGAHSPGDVVGGYAFGAALLAAVAGVWYLWIEGRTKTAPAEADPEPATEVP